MLDSRLEELNAAKKLMYEGNYRDALEIITSLEKKRTLTPEDQLPFLILKGRIFNIMEQFEEAAKVGELAYQISQKLGLISESINALTIKAQVMFSGKFEDGLQAILEAERLLNSFLDDLSPNVSRQKGNVLFLKGWVYYFLGFFNEGLELALQCLALREKRGNKFGVAHTLILISQLLNAKGETKEALEYAMKSLKFMEELNYKGGVAQSQSLIGRMYYHKGDFDQALKFGEQSLSIKEIRNQIKVDALSYLGRIYQEKGDLVRALSYFKRQVAIAEELNFYYDLSIGLSNMGAIHRVNGDYDKAIEFLKHGLKLQDEFNQPLVMVRLLLWLVLVNLDKNAREDTQVYLSHLEELTNHIEGKGVSHIYLFAKAMVFKKSGRTIKRAEAELLLRQISKYEDIPPDIFMLSLVSFCDFLLEELYTSNDLEILKEINPLIIRLGNIAEKQNSYLYLADTKLLQAKLALIQMNIEEAEKLMAQAEGIAELHGLNLLAIKISSEYDTLLEQLDIWDNLKKKNAPISERIKLASIDGVLDRIQGKRPIEPPELSDEEPTTLLVIAEGGVLIFSYPFTDQWKFDGDLFGGFITAFESFSNEFFSKGLDRAKIGEEKILVQSVSPFLVCYLFKGQSYLAKQKLTKFTESIQNQASIWQTLEKFYKMSQVLEIKDIPTLENIITDIFIRKNL